MNFTDRHHTEPCGVKANAGPGLGPGPAIPLSPRADVALCSVSPKSCTHHSSCLRAQLPQHPTRQAYCTPNRRGDECGLFVPLHAYIEPSASMLTADERDQLRAARVLSGR